MKDVDLARYRVTIDVYAPRLTDALIRRAAIQDAVDDQNVVSDRVAAVSGVPATRAELAPLPRDLTKWATRPRGGRHGV